MLYPPVPADEKDRLAALRRYRLLDTLPEAAFDRLTSLAARLFHVPLALVTLVDEDRQWFKACQGPGCGLLNVSETSREISFCAYTILSSEPLVVEDACCDPRFADNPFVTGEPGIRFYAGAPLVSAEGHALGSLCLLDFQPRSFTPEQQAALSDLAAAVVSEMDLRRVSVGLVESERLYRQMFEDNPHPMWVFDVETLRFLAVNETAMAHYGWSRDEFLAMTLADIRLPEDLPCLRDAHPGYGLHPGDRRRMRHRKKDGMLIWVEIAVHSIDYQGRPARMVAAQDVTESVEAEEALRRSEQKLSLHIQQTPMAAIEWSLDAKIVAWNPAAEQIFGYSEHETLGRHMLPILVPEQMLPQVHDIATALLSQKGGSRSTNENRTKDGRVIVCEWYNTPLIDRQGQVIGVAALAQDVTQQIRAQEKLCESERRFREIAETIQEVFWVSTADRSRIEYVSPAYERLWGRPCAELYAHPNVFVEAIHPEDRPQLLTRHGEGHCYDQEYRIIRPDGELRWIRTRSFPVQDGQGRTTRLVGISEDITQSRQVAEDLRQSQEQFSLFMDHLPGMAFIKDLNHRYVYVNEACVRAFDLPFEEWLGRTDEQIWPQEVAEMFLANDRLVLRSKSLLKTVDLVPQKDGLHHWQTEKFPILDRTGAPVLVGGIVTDLTERVALEADREALLAQTEALLADALEQADHDPLTGLINHRAFQKQMAEQTEAAQQANEPLALLLLNLDNFKFFNDAYGHAAGDDVLRQIAQALQATCRAEDTLARFGGDEFALLMPCATPKDAARLAVDLREAMTLVAYRPPGYDTSIPLNLSIGFACLPEDGPDRHEVLEAANSRLRIAKSGGDADGQMVYLRRSLSRSVGGFSMLDALVTAVDNKDRYTRKHSEDVMLYSLQIARALGLDTKTQHVVEVASLLHDVGKIGVPDAILRKPGKLSEEDFQAIQQHPLMGAVIVGAVPGFEDTLDAVRHHHERWDGQGYPFGLRGAETPLLARLMAVADAYSAMTTDRPYRQGMEPHRARRLLEEGAGTQWDPACVAAFLGTDALLFSCGGGLSHSGTGRKNILTKIS